MRGELATEAEGQGLNPESQAHGNWSDHTREQTAPFLHLNGTRKGVLKDMKECLSPELLLETESLE